MSDSIVSFLEAHRLLILSLHVLGTILGVGGATISDILFFKFLKDYRISKKEQEVLHVLATIVMVALGIIILTGVGLYLPEKTHFSASGAFLVKMIAVAVLSINGVALHLFVAPHLIHINLKHHGKMGENWHRFAFALGGVSVCSWYTVFFVAMLKSILPSSFSVLLGSYLLLLLIAIISTQIVEHFLHRKAA